MSIPNFDGMLDPDKYDSTEYDQPESVEPMTPCTRCHLLVPDDEAYWWGAWEPLAGYYCLPCREIVEEGERR